MYALRRQGGVEGGGMGAVNRLMIGPPGTVDLHVTTATKQWGERDQWLIACDSSLSRLGSLGPPPSLPCIK